MSNQDPVAQLIEGFTPYSVSPGVAAFAKELTAAAQPHSVNRAKAFLFAASRLGAFGEKVGLELSPEVLLCPSVIERLCHGSSSVMSAATRRTLRTNLRAISRQVSKQAPVPVLSRENAKAPYSADEIAAYLALCDAQPTKSRRMHTSALICLGAGAGVVGADLKAICGRDVVMRSGGVVVEITAGRRPRVVPVLTSYHNRLLEAADFAGSQLLIGDTSRSRRNVTTPLTSSLAGGSDLPRIEISRLRATWLCCLAEVIGLRSFMDAAGITCSQRLGDLVASLPAVNEQEAVALLGGRCSGTRSCLDA